MANKIEQIAEKKRKAIVEKQERDIEHFARKVADEVISSIGGVQTPDIKDSISELASSVAQAIIVSNQSFDGELKDSFTQLLSAIKNNKPDNTSLSKLNKQIGVSLAKFETALDRIELAPQITVNGLDSEQLKGEINKILAKLPSTSKRDVTISYENATADKYLNVRLTDGIKFYSAFSTGGSSGGREGGATESKQDDIITAIEGIGGVTNYTTRIATVGSLTYIGNAAIGSATSGAVWQIKRLDATSGLIKLWADGNDNYDNIWDNRASLSYS